MDPLKGDCYLIFTDGACSGNPGRGGWAAVVVDPKMEVTEIGGAADMTTNNRMELAGAIEALSRVSPTDQKPIFFYTDSTYVIYGITQWIWGWKRKNWINGEGQPVANKDLWLRLEAAVAPLKGRIDYRYSRGHVGIPGNERCDEIAVQRSQGRWVDLYSGPLIKYSIAIFDLPEDHSVPELRQREEKPKAIGYLSVLDGKVMRHKTWAACEKRVKGRSGAKFKKFLNEDEVGSILSGWSVSSNATIQTDPSEGK